MPDYEKFATKTMDTVQERGIGVTDPDAVEPIAKEVAEEYVIDQERLITIVRQRAEKCVGAGNIYENPPANFDDYPEADTAAEFLLAKASEYDVPDEEVEDVDWSKYHTDKYPEDHDITVPDRGPRWSVQYESSSKQAAVNIIECTENIEIESEFDFINRLYVDGNETVVQSLTKESFIIDVKQYKDED